MAKQVINRGTTPGDGTGETLYSAFTKANANFTELYDEDVVLAAAAATAQSTANGKEPALGNPASDGYVLSSSAAGARSWTQPAAGSGHTIEDEGTPLPAQTSLNFTGAGVSVADAGGKTVVTVAGGAAPVDSVNGQTGVVVLTADGISDATTTKKFTSAADISKLAAIEAAADVTDVTNVTAALDAATPATVTPVSGDFLLLKDASDSNKLKKFAFNDLPALAAIGQTNNEYTPAGVLVYPSHVPQTIVYNYDKTINYYKTTSPGYGGKIWRLAMTTYDANGNVTLMTATDDDGAGALNSWTRTLVYDADGILTSDGGWV